MPERTPTTPPRSDAGAASPGARRIAAVTPCFDAPDDFTGVLVALRSIADALAHADEPIDLRIVAVDNGSSPALATPPGADDDPRVRVLRLATNAGGSGGYNAGLACALLELDPAPEMLWLIDSDARATPETLRALVRALDADPGAACAGSAVAWPTTADVFEIGGVLDGRTGSLRGRTAAEVDRGAGPIACDYAAACSLLVRAQVARRAGLMPDVFLNGDDAAWCLRLARAAGGRVLAVPSSVVVHPRFDRAKGWPRYYTARNAFLPIEASGRSWAWRARARASRAWIEACRAAGQHAIGRPELATLHLRGLRDGAAGRRPVIAPADLATPARTPLRDLPTALTRLAPKAGVYAVDPALAEDPALAVAERALTEAGWRRAARTPSASGAPVRALVGPPADLAVVGHRGRPTAWFAGRATLVLDGDAFEWHAIRRGRALARMAGALALGAWGAARLCVRAPRVAPNATPTPATGRRPTLSIVVLVYNRREALGATLERLRASEPSASAEIVVVDNASTDGSADMTRERFPGARVLRMDENLGVEAFNRGVAAARGEAVLILDDDAWPEPAALEAALGALAADPTLGAVTLHPRHPSDGRSEWPFARARGDGLSRDWPVMGCGNLVRRAVWEALGGYESAFFLYRNDADLALKILGAGLGVGFHPGWVVWHDSPAAARKSPRWFARATRNWIWMCRRHGARGSGALAGLAGWAWAHRLAGGRLGDHGRVLAGVWAGLTTRAPALAPTCAPDGRGLRALLGLQARGRSSGSGASASDSVSSSSASSARHSA